MTGAAHRESMDTNATTLTVTTNAGPAPDPESASRIAALTLWAKANPVPGVTVDELVAAALTLEV